MALICQHLGRCDYQPVFEAMQAFTAARDADTPDELWRVEHPPVFTLGLAGKPEHLLAPGAIPVIQTDRGGQVTYHGPGQVVVYCLLDVKRLGLTVRALVTALEEAVIELLADYRIAAHARRTAPGVYVEQDGVVAKIAALGLRVRKGRCYHGLSFNVGMDLSPFLAINPCGYAGMPVTQTRDLGVSLSTTQIAEVLVRHLTKQLEQA